MNGHRPSSPGAWRHTAAALVLLALSIGIASPSFAQSKSKKARAEAAAAQASQTAGASSTTTETKAGHRTLSLSLKQLGAWSSIRLRGVDANRSLFFTIRADEVVVDARLKLAYDYSPSLIPELSHLNVSLNDRVVSLEGLPAGKGQGNAREIALNPRLFRDSNEMRFNFIGHYTRQCEDPFHSSLWLSIADVTRLELTLAPLGGAGDLRHLPAPFIDRRDLEPLGLPFVFASAPTPGTIKAAGVLASWFGTHAGTRGAQFPVVQNELPAGNAVLFLKGGESVAGIRAGAGSTLAVVQHPTNPRAKLLVVGGANDADLLRASNTIALASRTLSGATATITKETESAARKPYDAPAWLKTDRPMKLGEMVRPEELRVQGFLADVVRVNYRIPPDLFTWRSAGAPMRLKYRATRLPTHHSSAIAVHANNSFLDSIALNEPVKHPTDGTAAIAAPKVGDPSVRETAMMIPSHTITGRDQLQLTYNFDVVREGECRNLPPDNLHGAIDPESVVDFSGFPHYTAMPNLAHFAKLGFPFTRMADLSETGVVLSDRPTNEELSVYLSVMGRMGESTGYPALRHDVVLASEVDKVSGRDLILIGSANTHALMTKWADKLPMVQSGSDRKVRETPRSWRPTYRWEQRDIDSLPNPAGSLSITDVGNLTLMMGFESPLKSARSVVFLYADKPADLRRVTDVITDFERMGQVEGDFAIIDDRSVQHAKVSETYYVGSLPAASKVRWFLSDQPMLVAVLAALALLGIALLAAKPLRRLLSRRKAG